MSVRRALVDCAVLSVQDARVFYPCCKGCFSRIDAEQQDTTRCRCSRCGYSCLREQVDYRYRLSLKVARDRRIFGVTVFGTCLNPFFGLPASGLQRLVENSDGPVGASTRATLLAKAVEDCFIGRHFIFGIKVTGTESGLWFGEPVASGSSSKDTTQYIASQMILPSAAGQGGCTVVSYYRILLQKAAEYELGSTDPSKASGPPATTLLLLRPHHSPASCFSNATVSASGLLSQSPLRSHHQDCTLTPTPPWQQSLGLVTSSAEQEEGCSTQDSGDESSRQTDKDKTPHRVQRGCLENRKVSEERTLSPLLSLELSSSNSPSSSKYPYTSIEQSAGNTPTLNTWFSPSQPGHTRDLPLRHEAEGFSTRQLTQTFLSSSLAWEDLPFSESLTEFLCEENKDFNSGSENEPHTDVQNQNKTVRNNLEIRSHDKNLSIESTSVCQSNTQTTESHPQGLLDITNTLAPNNGGDRQDLSDHVCMNSVGCVNKSQARSTCFHQCTRQDEEACSLSLENKEEEQLAGETFDCSADLFSSSLASSVNTEAINARAETVGTPAEARPLLCSPVKQHPRCKKAETDKQKRKSNKYIHRDSSIPPGTQDLDFIPPAQSTPIVKAAVRSGSPASSYSSCTLGELSSQPESQDLGAFYCDLPESGSKKPTSIPSPLWKPKTASANQLSQFGTTSTKESTPSSGHKHIFTPKRRFWKPGTHRNQPLVQRGAPNQGPTATINHKCDSSVCDVTACDCEDADMIVLPTPVAKTRLGVKVRRRRRTDNSGSHLDRNSEARQGDGVRCKRSLLDQTLTLSSQEGLHRTGNGDSETVDGGSLDASKCCIVEDENQACDWSRDLFSDSV